MKLFGDTREAKMYCFSIYVFRVRSVINKAQTLKIQDLKEVLKSNLTGIFH